MLRLDFSLYVINVVILTSAVVSAGVKGSCDKVDIVERETWRARPLWRARNMYNPLNHVVMCHTAGEQCWNEVACVRRVQMIQTFHLDDKGWWDIAYNFLIGGDGRVYIGRGWNHTGAHSVNFNTNSVGIAFIGNYMLKEPTKAMLDAALLLIDCGVQRGFLTPSREIHGAKDVTCTDSPGPGVYEHIKKWKNFRGGRITNYSCPNRPPTPPPANDTSEKPY